MYMCTQHVCPYSCVGQYLIVRQSVCTAVLDSTLLFDRVSVQLCWTVPYCSTECLYIVDGMYIIVRKSVCTAVLYSTLLFDRVSVQLCWTVPYCSTECL